MRHRKVKKTFDRKRASREALLRGLATNLFTRGKITASTAQAKELRRVAERLITLAKRGKASQRTVDAYLYTEVAQKALQEKLTAYAARSGGYTRMIKLSPRKGDGASQARIEFVQ